MNIDKLRAGEHRFLADYPGGFDHPEMIELSKKHKVDKLVTMAKSYFDKPTWDDVEEVVDHMNKLVSESSMVSRFEKPQFRDAVKSMTHEEKSRLVHGLREMLHGDQEIGFNMMLDVLLVYKLAKWPLMTVYWAYYAPLNEVFIKPTTAKNVIKFFELEDIEYKPRPSYEFYKKYRAYIKNMRSEVEPSLAPSNAAFSGFLMMVMEFR